MIDTVKDYLVGLAIGIRFRHNFSLQDKFGVIADNILYKKESFFNPEIFTEINVSPFEMKLVDQSTGNFLTINTGNVILGFDFGDKIKVSDMEQVIDGFNADLIQGVLEKYNITGINRLGYIRKYIFTIEELSKVFIDKTISGTLDGVNDINLRFSKKLPIEEAIVKKGVNDYYNIIYSIIKKADKKETFISVDFQRYYNPALEQTSQLQFSKFLKAGLHPYGWTDRVRMV
jgi:hypothetical protein